MREVIWVWEFSILAILNFFNFFVIELTVIYFSFQIDCNRI